MTSKISKTIGTAGLLLAASLVVSPGLWAGPGKGSGKPPKDSGPANPVIAFSVGKTWSIDGIKVMDADGGNQTEVLSSRGTGLRIHQPSWSSDGRFLAFYEFGCPDGPGVGLLELIDPDTNTWSGPILLVCKTPPGTATPAFSPVQDGNTYTLAYFGRDGAVPFPGPGGRVTEDLIVITFDAPVGGPISEMSRYNITNTPGISEIWPSWSPSADEIVVETLDIRANPDVPSMWVHDIVIYDVAGAGPPESLVRFNPAFDNMMIDSLENPDWAKTSDDMVLFAAGFNGGDSDIWCVERGPSEVAINVTQHLDDKEGAERSDSHPSWLPDDSGFVFSRNQIVELRFGDGYDPAIGCPTALHLDAASDVVLAQGKGRGKVGQPDYWRNALSPGAMSQ